MADITRWDPFSETGSLRRAMDRFFVATRASTARTCASFSLPTEVDADKAEARFENGVLHLSLPKAESMTKTIKVGGGQSGRRIIQDQRSEGQHAS